jgi:hypothetical protein
MYNEKINATSVAGENKNTGINTNVKVMIKNEVKIGTEVKKVAFVDGNRAINENNVKKHAASLEKFGRNLVRLLYVDANDVEGYDIHDADTDEIVEKENYGDYIVILDGQHRFKAAMRLAADENKDFSLDSLRWDKVELDGHSFQDVLIEVNTRTQPWKGSDYISGCVLNNPQNEIALFAKEVTSKGASAKTVNKYIFFEDKFSWANAMKDEEVLNKADLQRAKEIWKVVITFPESIVKKSLIIDRIKEKGGKGYWKQELDKVVKLTDEQKKTLGDIKVVSTQKSEFDRMVDNA